MRKYKFIYGTTDLAENLFYLLRQDGDQVDGFVVDKEFYTENLKFGIPVIDYDSLQKGYDASDVSIYLCIGYNGMNVHRKNKYQELKQNGYEICSYIHKSAIVETDDLGEGNLILENAYVGMYSKLGDGNILYPKSLIAHHTKVGDFNFFSISSSVAGDVVVGNENFFGNNCFTKDKIKIGNKNLIGAGAYVSVNMGDDNVLVPARSGILQGKKSVDFL